MKKVCLLVLVMFGVLNFKLLAAEINSRQPGQWNDTNTWSCLCIPGINDDVTIEHAISSTGEVTIKSLGFSTEWSPIFGHGQLTVSSGTFTVNNGTIPFGLAGQNKNSLTILSGATFSTSQEIKWNQAATVVVNGTLEAGGFDVGNGNGGSFTVGEEGSATFGSNVNIGSGPHTFNINGNFQAKSLTMSGSTFFNVGDKGDANILNDVEMSNGYMEIEGALKIGGNLKMEGGSHIYVEGSLDVVKDMALAHNNGGNLMVSGPGRITAGSCSRGNCPNFTPLPVNLLYFTAITQNQSIEISWASSKAWDFSHYELERSSNGTIFEYVATIDAAEFSNETVEYAYSDRQPLFGHSYYRLKAVDVDGSFEYKEMAGVKFGTESFKVYPNPSAQGFITVSWSDAGDGAAASLRDNTGRTVRITNLSADNKTISTEGLSAGVYYLSVQGPAGQKQAQVLIQ